MEMGWIFNMYKGLSDAQSAGKTKKEGGEIIFNNDRELHVVRWHCLISHRDL